MTIAITRTVSPTIGTCELTHLTRREIDLERAQEQHEAYEECLRSLGCEVRRLAVEPDLPDAVFVEDTAVVLDELAILSRPGMASRRLELPSVGEALRPLRDLETMGEPATLDGGDVLRTGRELFVALSSRTNAEGIARLRELAEPLDYRVRELRIKGCLHLKSAATEVAPGTLLVNPDWVDASAFEAHERIEIDSNEPFSANALRVGDAVVLAAAHAGTRAVLEERGLRVETVDVSELAKAEGGVTCCCLLVGT